MSTPVPMAWHDRKVMFVLHVYLIDLRNAIIPLASIDTGTGINGIT